jgi:hypothetical protein
MYPSVGLSRQRPHSLARSAPHRLLQLPNNHTALPDHCCAPTAPCHRTTHNTDQTDHTSCASVPILRTLIALLEQVIFTQAIIVLAGLGKPFEQRLSQTRSIKHRKACLHCHAIDATTLHRIAGIHSIRCSVTALQAHRHRAVHIKAMGSNQDKNQTMHAARLRSILR